MLNTILQLILSKRKNPFEMQKLKNEQAFSEWKMRHEERELATDRQKTMMEGSYKRAQSKYLNAMTDLMSNSSNVSSLPAKPADMADMTEETTYSPADYQLTNETRNIRGIPSTVSVRKLKPAVSEKHGDVITANSNLLSQLETAKDFIKKGAFTGIANKLPFADTVRKQFGSNASISLAQVMKQMQSGYITSQTGAQRGFKEMVWYEPSMPTIDMPTNKILPMLESSARLQELNVRNLLHTAQKKGERLGEFKDTYDQLLEKYPLNIIPYGIAQSKADKYSSNIEKIKIALKEGYSQEEIDKFLNK